MRPRRPHPSLWGCLCHRLPRCTLPGITIVSPIAMAMCPGRSPVGMPPSVCVPSPSLQQTACPMAPGIFPKSPGCRPCRHDTQCRCTRPCCVPFRFADIMIYLGCTPSGMRIATGMRPRSPQPRNGDLHAEPPYGVPPLWCACHRAPHNSLWRCAEARPNMHSTVAAFRARRSPHPSPWRYALGVSPLVCLPWCAFHRLPFNRPPARWHRGISPKSPGCRLWP